MQIDEVHTAHGAVQLSMVDDTEACGKDSSHCTLFHALVIGLPCEASHEELLKLFDSMASEMVSFLLLQEVKQYDGGNLPIQHIKRFCLASFSSESSRQLFSSLYHNVPMTSYADCPPCLVLHPQGISITTNDNTFANTFPCLQQLVDAGTSKGVQLPTCSLCLRRMRLCATLPGPRAEADHDILVGRSFCSNPCTSSGVARCMVCDIHSSLSALPSSLRSCSACGLQENIWVCLLCASAGCGRYTAMHAQSHSLSSGHRYALELVSGRIWDYACDTFAHYEGAGMVACCTDLRFDALLPAASVSAQKMLVSPTDLLQRERLVEQSIGPQVVSKLSAVAVDYERLMDQQLAEQQMFYEKQLARETARAMAFFYEGVDEVQDMEALQSDLNDIENLKLVISKAETDYRSLLQQMQAVDEENRKYKADNNNLLRKQKQLVRLCCPLTDLC